MTITATLPNKVHLERGELPTRRTAGADNELEPSDRFDRRGNSRSFNKRLPQTAR